MGLEDQDCQAQRGPEEAGQRNRLSSLRDATSNRQKPTRQKSIRQKNIEGVNSSKIQLVKSQFAKRINRMLARQK